MSTNASLAQRTSYFTLYISATPSGAFTNISLEGPPPVGNYRFYITAVGPATSLLKWVPELDYIAGDFYELSEANQMANISATPGPHTTGTNTLYVTYAGTLTLKNLIIELKRYGFRV